MFGFGLLLLLLIFSGCAGPQVKSRLAVPDRASPSSPSSEVQIAQKESTPPEKPTLVVWLTVDQFRGDYLERYRDHFLEDGFLRLVNNGTWYSNAHFSHAITETAPGHATLFTGAPPSVHGIVGNSWLRDDGFETVSVLDEESLLVGPGEQETESKKGRSPHLLLVPTIGDELLRSTQGRAKVVGISTKDRGAILPAGMAGQAFWLGREGFVSSQYYFKTAPAWLLDHHKSHPPQDYLADGWELLKPAVNYRNPESESSQASVAMGRGFPHLISPETAPTKALASTPFGDTAVLDLARTVIKEAGLGADEVVDLLSLSLSSTDAIGHQFGPESREFEDQLFRLDQQLAQFFHDLDQVVGAGRLLFVLSADHGGCESAEFLQKFGLPGRRLTEPDLAQEVKRILVDHYGHARYLLGVNSPYVFLDPRAFKNAGVKRSEVAALVAEELAAFPGVHRAFTRDFRAGQNAFEQGVEEALHPYRSGDLYIVPDPYTLFLQDEDLTATHGSPWNYDSHVPVVISGPSIPHQRVDRWVSVSSLVPTVARLMGISPPPAALQPWLTEVFD